MSVSECSYTANVRKPIVRKCETVKWIASEIQNKYKQNSSAFENSHLLCNMTYKLKKHAVFLF